MINRETIIFELKESDWPVQMEQQFAIKENEAARKLVSSAERKDEECEIST